MALTDPELEMLRELLEEDPGADEFIVVGVELVRREAWGDAVRVLVAGLDAVREAGGEADERLGWELLAQAASADGQYLRALAALARVGVGLQSPPRLLRMQVLAYARSGQPDRALEGAQAYLLRHGDDAALQELVQRLSQPSGDGRRHKPDPMLTAERAEDYIGLGRVDRAVRAYRRILFHNPGDTGLAGRLRELLNQPHDLHEDDLSEELPDPGVAPPDLFMPRPNFGMPDDAPAAAPSLDLYSDLTDDVPTDTVPLDRDHHESDATDTPTGLRRRRSLIRR